MSADPARHARARRAFPRKADITRAVEAAKACGIEVAGFEITSIGSIKVLGQRCLDQLTETEFDRWDRDGRL